MTGWRPLRHPGPLGRLEPTDFEHVAKYPAAAVQRRTVAKVERSLRLPRYRVVYHQPGEGPCVGFASSWMMSILNRKLYDAIWLWNRAKEVDEYPQTNPGDDRGTSVRAAMDVLRAQGHCVMSSKGVDKPPSRAQGIAANRWATTVDEIRTSVAAGTPVVLGAHWYTNFDAPVEDKGDWWIGRGDLGTIRGGHAVCVYGASDRRQGFRIVNSWGPSWPLPYVPYPTVERLISERGEVTLVTDR